MSLLPPSKPDQDSHNLSSSDQRTIRPKVVEVLATTANGCISELGYHPAMPQAMKELEACNKKWQMENSKLYEDNRCLVQLLRSRNEQIAALDNQTKHLVLERDHFKDLWEGKLSGPSVPVIEYQRLRAEYIQITDKYKYWKQEFMRAQRAMHAIMGQNPQVHPGGVGVTQNFPPPVSSIPTPTYTSAPHPQGHSAYPHSPRHYEYRSHEIQQPSPLHGQPPPRVHRTVPSQQVPSNTQMQTQRTLGRRPAAGSSLHVPSKPPGPSHQRRPSDNRTMAAPPLPDDKNQVVRDMIAPTKENGAVNGVAHNILQTSALVNKLEASPPLEQVTQPTAVPLSPGDAVPKIPRPMQSGLIQAPSLSIPSQAADQQVPLTPINAVASDMQNSGFAKQQAASPTSIPHEAPTIQLPPIPLAASCASPDSQIPLPQHSLLLAPNAPTSMSEFSSNGATGPAMPELTISPSASPKSSSPLDPSEVSTPGGTNLDSTKVASSPIIVVDSVKRVREESTEDIEDGSRKKQRLEEQTTEASVKPAEGEEQVEEEDEEEEEEEEDIPIEIGPDGLRTESSCLAMLIAADETNPDKKNCRLCQGRYTIGAVQEPPKPFEGASEAELVQHCLSEHFDAWDALRNDVG